MSKYTMELRGVCKFFGRDVVESWFKDYELSDYLTPDEIEVINSRGTWSKDKLARKIVDHYYLREIGMETPEMFRLYAKIMMQELMEEKLPLIYSASIKYDPLVNVDYQETFERNIGTTGEANSNSNSNSSGISVISDTPQGQINKEEVLAGSYASNVNASETETGVNDSSTTSSDTNEDYIKRVKGNSGVSATAQKMVEQYRNNIIAIDKDIIKDLYILFMGIY